MLNEIHLENFKAFGPLQKIPLKPITLLYGANSAGKTSILHSLLYVKEIFQTTNLDVSLIGSGDDNIDLGGIVALTHKTVKNRIMLHLKFNIESGAQERKESLFASKEPIESIEIQIKIDPASYNSKQIIYFLDLYVNGIQFYSKDSPNHMGENIINYNHPLFKEITFNNQDDKNEFIKILDYIGFMSELIETASIGIIPYHVAVSLDKSDLFPFVTGERKVAELNKEQLKRFNSEVNSEVFQWLSCLHKLSDQISQINGIIKNVFTQLNTVIEQVNKTFSISPLRIFPQRNDLLFKGYIEYYNRVNLWGKGDAFEKLSYYKKLLLESYGRGRVNTWLKKKEAILPYTIEERKYVSIKDAYRVLADYEAILYNSLPDEVLNMRINDLTPEVIKQIKSQYKEQMESNEIIQNFFNNLWINQAVFGLTNETIKDTFKLHFIKFEDSFEIINELVIRNVRTGREESIRDLGVGISQLLPIITYSLTHNGIILVEEPEIHLHPALQSELGDLFIDSIKDYPNKKILVETHSEHILLRIMRRIRETTNNTLPEGVNGITPDDVAVLYVENKGDHSVVKHINLDEEGNLLDPFPGGFFEEGFNEFFS